MAEPCTGPLVVGAMQYTQRALHNCSTVAATRLLPVCAHWSRLAAGGQRLACTSHTNCLVVPGKHTNWTVVVTSQQGSQQQATNSEPAQGLNRPTTRYQRARGNAGCAMYRAGSPGASGCEQHELANGKCKRLADKLGSQLLLLGALAQCGINHQGGRGTHEGMHGHLPSQCRNKSCCAHQH